VAVARIPDQTATAKQRAVVYLSGNGQRGQMFLLPGADNYSHATASARQYKCGHLVCLHIENNKDTVHSHVRADIKCANHP